LQFYSHSSQNELLVAPKHSMSHIERLCVPPRFLVKPPYFIRSPITCNSKLTSPRSVVRHLASIVRIHTSPVNHPHITYNPPLTKPCCSHPTALGSHRLWDIYKASLPSSTLSFLQQLPLSSQCLSVSFFVQLPLLSHRLL